MDCKNKSKSFFSESDKSKKSGNIPKYLSASKLQFGKDFSNSLYSKVSLEKVNLKEKNSARTYSEIHKSKLFKIQGDLSPYKNSMNNSIPWETGKSYISNYYSTTLSRKNSDKFISCKTIKRFFPLVNTNKSNSREKETRSSSEHRLDENDIKIKNVLKQIFDYYCNFVDRINPDHLKLNQFLKFVSDSELIDSKFTINMVEIIFISKNKKRHLMDFDSFLESLLKIAEIKYLDSQNITDNFGEKNSENKNATCKVNYNHKCDYDNNRVYNYDNPTEDKLFKKIYDSLEMLLKLKIFPLFERIYGATDFTKTLKTLTTNSHEKKIISNSTIFCDIKFSDLLDVNYTNTNYELNTSKKNFPFTEINIYQENSEFNNIDQTESFININNKNAILNHKKIFCDNPSNFKKSESNLKQDKNHQNILNNKIIMNKNRNSTATSMINSFNDLTGLNQMRLKNLNVKNDINNSELKPNLEMSEDTKKLIISVTPILYEIYSTFFPWEISNIHLHENLYTRKKMLYQNFLLFLKYFDICPTLLIKNDALKILQSELAEENVEMNEYETEILKVIYNNFAGWFNNSLSQFGEYFTFIKFHNVILKLAYYSFDNELKLFERICFLLERMQVSDGLEKVYANSKNPNPRKTLNLISIEFLNKVKKNIKNRIYAENVSKYIEDKNTSDNSLDKEDKIKIRFYPEGQKGNLGGLNYEHLRKNKLNTIHNGTLHDFKEIFELTNIIIQKYGDYFHNIFKYYASYGDPSNFKFLKSSKFHKFLKDSNLVANSSSTASDKIEKINKKSNENKNLINKNLLEKTEIENIFMKVAMMISDTNTISNNCHNFYSKERNLSGKNYIQVDFYGFIKLIEIIVLILVEESPSIEEAARQFIETHFLTNTKQIQNDFENDTFYALNDTENNMISDTMNDPNLVREVMNTILFPFFKCYDDNQGLLSLEAFFNFQIFPNLVPKSKLIFYFKNSNDGSSAIRNGNTYEEIVNVGFEKFIDIMINCACEIKCHHYLKNKEQERIIIKKIIILLETVLAAPCEKEYFKLLKLKSLHTKKSEFYNLLQKAFPWYYLKEENLEFHKIIAYKERDLYCNKENNR